ncbi:F0F1 ATP synthase subunit epsilon [Halodurantibacterium flavum]|uniref:ATP synthase epsilon chain n=1 Tax=Halodurantibacterium flavum TaxID=1382802 RepID=A0ABW4S2A2_9RHOB
MAKTMQFDLVSPERRLTSVQATEVQIPAAEGYMTAMPDHSPTIATLRPGVLRVRSTEGTAEYAVTGGFAEITPAATSVLAERALPVAEVTAEIMDGMIAEAQAAADRAAPEARADAELLVSDYRALRTAVGV